VAHDFNFLYGFSQAHHYVYAIEYDAKIAHYDGHVKV
jgi:hypothetical protein